MENLARQLFYLIMLILLLHVSAPRLYAADEGGATGFVINAFEMTGNTIFPEFKLQDAVRPFIGSGKTAADVEKARDALEKLYHDSGYIAVIVNIPEQTLVGGIVKLEVIESRIGRVKITGNHYFTMEKIMKDLPSLAPGGMLYLPDVQKDISRVNRSEDFKVDPIMSPGREVGFIDVELKVTDHMPLHGYLELNNRTSPNTDELRLNAMVRYDNLWQLDHSLALQFQTAPQKPNQVTVAGASYVLNAPWETDNQIAMYGISSNTNVAFGEGFKIVGRGYIYGIRYVVPLTPYKLYSHNITFGLDYKSLDQSLGFVNPANGAETNTPVRYMPFVCAYNSYLPDGWGGMTQFNAGLNMAFRGIVSQESEFENKRYMAQADYAYATMGVERTQKLPRGMNLTAKVDGQVSNQPLIDSEQYTAGGIESVRGYLESEEAGDNAFHTTVEVSFPSPLEKTATGKWFQPSPFIFYDIATLFIKDPLPSQENRIRLEGTGIGIRGSITKTFDYEAVWAMALQPTAYTQRDEQRIHFKVKASF